MLHGRNRYNSAVSWAREAGGAVGGRDRCVSAQGTERREGRSASMEYALDVPDL
jgi:hypothetical protein